MSGFSTRNSSSPTRLSGGWVFIARLIWLLIFLLSVGKLVLGLPLHYAELNTVCMASEADCRQGNSLDPLQVQALESIGIQLKAFAQLALSWEVITSVVWAGIGLFVFFLRSDDWLALVTSAMMILFVSSGDETQIRTVYPYLGTAADLIFNLGNILMFLFIGLFPNGRFSPRWMRWYWLGMITISLVPTASWLRNPEIANTVISIYWISFLILGPYSQIFRYRKVSTPVERQQTKWVVLGFAAFAGILLVGFALTGLLPVNSLGRLLYQTFLFDIAGLLIPLSVGFSVLRYRLWDVDLIIRRTLVYGALTATLALVYFGSVLLLQGLLGRLTGVEDSPAGGSFDRPLAIVVSTLLVSALVTPLRRRIQNDIDRRFYRQKYNAERALAEFALAARNETDLQTLTNRLVNVVQETVQPERVAIWMKEGRQ